MRSAERDLSSSENPLVETKAPSSLPTSRTRLHSIALPGYARTFASKWSFSHPPCLQSIAPFGHSLLKRKDVQPKVPAFACVDPVETAADKLSALAWRVCIRNRGTETDDPTVIRHLHDLAALEPIVAEAPAFNELLRSAVDSDTGRGGGNAPTNPAERFALMLGRLTTEAGWADGYSVFPE
jgi:hypothetical protein